MRQAKEIRLSARARLWLCLACLTLSAACGAFAAPRPGSGTGAYLEVGDARRALLVLDPVDLSFDSPKRTVGDFLRQRASESRRWTVAHGDSSRKHMREFRLDPDMPCKEFQCAFDAGSALGQEFVLFGTLAPLGALQAYTLNLLHVPTAQVVWSRAGEALRHEDEYPFQAQKRALEWALTDLDMSRLDLRKRSGREAVALFDDGSSVQSKALHERAVSHLYAARRFDLVHKGEMADLLHAMEVSPPAPHAPEESLLAVGRKLDVRYVVSSRLVRSRKEYKLKVAMHDFEGKARKTSMPIRTSQDFGKLLRHEDKFFSKLGDHDFPDRVSRAPSAIRTTGKVLSVTMALAAGAGLGYLAYRSKMEADGEYQDFHGVQSGRSATEIKQRVQSKDEEALRFGILSGVSVVLGTVIWAF